MNSTTAQDLGLDEGYILCRGGRTGKKIHSAFAGSSVTACGHWMKASASFFKVPSAHPNTLCERCFPEVSR